MRSLVCAFIVALFFTSVSATAQIENTPAPLPTLDSVIVKDYVGKFDAGIGTITITWDKGKLNCELEGKGSAEIIASSMPDVLNIVGYGGTISFIRDEQKKVNKVIIEVQGQTFEGVRF